MKRLGSSDSLGALMSICPTSDEQSPRSTHVYSREFQNMLEGLDEEGCVEESGHVAEKKRRLSVDQVKALEKNFEIENKLEPERKVKLAQELGLQPRQVAVWFQNRRARWKTKQLERDYNVLRANYDNLKLSFESLQRDNESLANEVRELRTKLEEEDGSNMDGQISIKEEEIIIAPDSDNKSADQTIGLNDSSSLASVAAAAAVAVVAAAASEDTNMSYEGVGFNNAAAEGSLLGDLKDGSSDSDSSAILHESSSPIAASSSFQNYEILPLAAAAAAASSSPAVGCFNPGSSQQLKAYQPQFVKMEEHNFFGVEESCNFFSDEQAPTLQWYSDQWS